MVLNEPRESEQRERPTTDASEQPKDTFPFDLAILESRKRQLEIEKLEEEVKTSREGREWWRKSIREVKFSEWVTAVAAIVALAVAFWTGLFNSTREKLSAQADRLAIEQIELQQKRDKLGVDVAVMEKELTEIKERLLPYEQESDAIHQLRGLKSKLLHVSLALTADYDAYSVTVDGLDEKLDWNTVPKARINPSFIDSLRTINRLRSVKGLCIRGLRIRADDLPLICQHREIEALVLREADIDRKILGELRGLPNLNSLNLELNNIDSLEGCGAFPQVKILNLRNNPIGDPGLAKLASAFPGLQRINLANTEVTDAGMQHLKLLPDLIAIDLIGTKITGDGLLPIVVNRTISVRINKGSISKKTIEALKQANPNSLSIIEQTTNDILRDAFDNRDRW